MRNDLLDRYFAQLEQVDFNDLTPDSERPMNLIDLEKYNLDESIAALYTVTSQDNDIEQQISSVVKFIVFNFDAASQLTYTGNPFGFYLTFSQVINKTLGLLELVQGKSSKWRNPKNPLFQMSNHFERNFISGMFPSLGLQIANVYKRNFIDWFLDLLDEVNDKFDGKILPDTISMDDIETYLDYIYERDFLWNFRPVNGCKYVFRSPDPSKFYEDTQQLEKFLVKNNIKTIIDLRGDRESTKHTSRAFETYLADLNINRLVLNFNEPSTPGDSSPGYVKKAKYLKDTVLGVMKSIIETVGSVLFHCASGKDRTGVMGAILQMLVGFSDEQVIKEYSKSGHDTYKERIIPVIQYIEELGGVKAYLKSCGLTTEEIAALKAKLT